MGNREGGSGGEWRGRQWWGIEREAVEEGVYYIGSFRIVGFASISL